MIKVPHFLYTNDIIDTIKRLIDIYNAEDFDSLNDSTKNILIEKALIACEYDIEIILSRDTNKCVANNISSPRVYTLLQSIQQDFYDHFSYAFNYIFKEIIDEIKREKSPDVRFASWYRIK